MISIEQQQGRGGHQDIGNRQSRPDLSESSIGSVQHNAHYRICNRIHNSGAGYNY
ncbi:hypothetical protein D3C80_2005670 [compost metagenome]